MSYAIPDIVTPTAEAKRARVLDGAMKVFLAYGFTRTTMDDIAKAADMSRPSLYLLFRNKTEIYRALTELFLERCLATADAALKADGTFEDRVLTALHGDMVSMMRAIMASPHGAEILDMKNALAGDLIATWRGRFAAAVEKVVAAEAKARGVDLKTHGLSAAFLADMLLDGLDGMKARITDLDRQTEAARGLVRVFDLALRP